MWRYSGAVVIERDNGIRGPPDQWHDLTAMGTCASVHAPGATVESNRERSSRRAGRNDPDSRSCGATSKGRACRDQRLQRQHRPGMGIAGGTTVNNAGCHQSMVGARALTFLPDSSGSTPTAPSTSKGIAMAIKGIHLFQSVAGICVRNSRLASAALALAGRPPRSRSCKTVTSKCRSASRRRANRVCRIPPPASALSCHPASRSRPTATTARDIIAHVFIDGESWVWIYRAGDHTPVPAGGPQNTHRRDTGRRHPGRLQPRLVDRWNLHFTGALPLS